jgi:S1-C subfamily serine protease
MDRGDEEPSPQIGQGSSGPGGAFTLFGLEDGPYKVMLASSPFDTVDVTVSGGVADREVELTTAGGGLLERNGFALETDVDGTLVVTSVDPEGAAAQAGLLVGDRIQGVTVMGFDLSEHFPELGDLFTDFVLDRFGGAVGLVVERDGAVVKIDLE